MPNARRSRPQSVRRTGRHRRRGAALVSAILGVGLWLIAPASAVQPPDAVPGFTLYRLGAPHPTTPPSASPRTARPAGLKLPRIPWEGGPSYWKQFADAKNWAKPSFFPIGVWYNGISTDREVRWDKAHGVDFYAGMWEGTNFSLFRRNHVYWVGEKLNSSFPAHSPYWPGSFLDDEVDGRYPPQQGFRYLQQLVNESAGKGRFIWSNFTQQVIGSDMPLADQERYVNGFTDAVSLDMYWYTIPFCDWRPYRGNLYAAPVRESTCRTASSYGRTINSLTIRDRADHHLQPRWAFVEDLNGGPDQQQFLADITPAQLKGAAMSAVINEARGLVWFNQSLGGPCQTSEALRTAQVEGPGWCGYPQIRAMGQVDNLIHRLARVINTQSYRWRFGSGLDTMLKVYRGKAYVFAMTNGVAGTRTLKLPPGVHGTSVKVIGERRSLPVHGHRFQDTFAAESSYHVYRVSL